MASEVSNHSSSSVVVRRRVVAAIVVAVLVVSAFVLGEPSRPATATVVRPVVTVQALCTVPTIIDVAAGEPTRGLSGVHDLLGVDDPFIGEAAREVSIVDTRIGTYFTTVDDGELRVAALGRTGLPVLAPATDEDVPPSTYRVFSLGDELAGREPLVVPGDEEVFLVFGGDDAPVTTFRLDVSTISSPTAELSGSQDPDGPVIASLAARPGAAVSREGVLWLASDDGGLWSYDPALDSSDRWDRIAEGLDGPVLARGQDAVFGVFATDIGQAEVRGYHATDEAPSVRAVDERELTVEAATFGASEYPAFVLRAPETRPGQLGVLRVDGGAATQWVEGAGLEEPALGLVATDRTAAALTVRGGALTYQVLDGAQHAGTFPVESPDEDCVTMPGWPDTASVVSPLSAGSLLHLHDPGSQFDCIIDSRERLDELEQRCAPDGDWSLDKGAAPESDFSVEVGRALEEHAQEESERQEQDPEEAADAPRDDQQLQDELADVGLATSETDPESEEGLTVDEELTDVCADEVVSSVVAPSLDDAQPIGDRALRAEWTWAGGQCLPERYLVETCLLASDGATCADRNRVEVSGAGSSSNRFATEVPTRPDRTYRVTVTAFKGQVASDPSNALLVRMPPAVPEAPTNVSSSLSGGVFTVSWASCLDSGDCDQRPEAFIVTVEGCDGDGLGTRRHQVATSERRVTYDLNGSGFPDADLLGRRVRFRVASSAAGYTSDSVVAGDCREAVRGGRTVAASEAPVSVSLSGRTTSMRLEGPSRGSGLTQLFGTSTYDDVSARLVRGDTTTSRRGGALGGTVDFTVSECRLDGWTIELTPRRGGSDLNEHTARLTGARAACGWAVTDSTSPTAEVTGGSGSTYRVTVRIPGLAEDVRNDKVDRVTATTTCDLALGGSADATLSGGTIEGNSVRFEGNVPAVFDLAGACRVAPTVVGTDGARVTTQRTAVDLGPVSQAVVDQVGPRVVAALQASTTGTYEGLRDLPIHVPHPDAHVRVRMEGSGVGCSRAAGSSNWTFRVSGGAGDSVSCSDGVHGMSFYRRHLEGGRADVSFRVQLGSAEYRSTADTNICGLPGGDRQQPCAEPAEPCEWDDDLPYNDPNCVEPPRCEWDDDLPADDPNCVEPPTCEWDDELPPDDPDCLPPDPDPGDGDGNGRGTSPPGTGSGGGSGDP